MMVSSAHSCFKAEGSSPFLWRCILHILLLQVLPLLCLVEGNECCGCAGSDRAVTQLEAGKAMFDIAGYISFLLWRSVYVTKQVHSHTYLPFCRKIDGCSLAPADDSASCHGICYADVESHRGWQMHAGQHKKQSAHPL